MKTILVNTFILSLFVALLGCEKSQAQNVGEIAPDFSLQTLEGETFTLSEQKGKVVFIFLFGNNCPHCIANAPNTENSIYQVFKNNDMFEAVGIDTWNGSKSSVQAFKNRTNLTYRICTDGSAVQSAYNTTYDRILVVDQEGILRYKATANATSSVTADAAAVIDDLLKSGTTGINQSELIAENILAYPNPVSDVLNVRLGYETGKKARLEVIDQLGKAVYSEERTVGQSGEITINVETYPAGIYFLRSIVDEKREVTRLVIR